MINIAIFVSGSGTNCENLIKYFADSERVNCALVLQKNNAFLRRRSYPFVGAAPVYTKDGR